MDRHESLGLVDVRNHMSKLFVRVMFAAVIGAGGIASMVACGDDDDKAITGTDAGSDSPAETGNDALPGSVAGNANYTGTKKGPLYLSLFASLPPTGAPAGIGAVNTPTWPGSNSFKITNVNPGQYLLVSYISVGTDHNMGPQPGDPVSQPVPVVIESGKEAKQDVVLADVPEDGGLQDAPNEGG